MELKFFHSIYIAHCNFLKNKQHALFIYSRAVVFVKVLDVDEFSPKFEKTSLFADLREGKVYDSLVKVKAIDQDESLQYGKICGYEIITPGVPFSVDNEGNFLIW